ncbi:N-acetylmuramoyl-L-alanine amidase [Sulfitobacter albidus]|uniref:N-acetylmuramoyl-L-alanine amidase n=2 Tax=Sulfitobacter albidus TaxID=2829501 RepID=A0A975JGT8_9RHOB|nr:N-acetylmuramoyl-L-alanine amidase [Sulfitobacter albidus]
MQSCGAARDRLCDPSAEVSAHYLIDTDGTVLHLVDEAQRAWHAGAGEWAGRGDINSRSIGIELDNDGATPFAEAQMRALEPLMHGIMQRWDIPAFGVIGHSDMAPGRKVDPGPLFDWPWLEAAGLARARGVDPGPRDATPEMFRQVAVAAGYTAPCSDADLLQAVRLRYRAGAEGPLCPQDFTPLGHAALWT